jgi:hypothetical protein
MATLLGPEAPAGASRAEMYCRTPSNVGGQSAEFELQFKMLEPGLAALTSGAFNGDTRASADSRAGRAPRHHDRVPRAQHWDIAQFGWRFTAEGLFLLLLEPRQAAERD